MDNVISNQLRQKYAKNFLKFREKGPFFLLCVLFAVAFVIPDKKTVTNIYRVLICLPVFLIMCRHDLFDFVKIAFFKILLIVVIYTSVTIFWSQGDKGINVLGRIVASSLFAYLLFLLHKYDLNNFKKIPLMYLASGIVSIIMVLFNWDGLFELDRWSIRYGILDHHAPLSWFFSVCCLISVYCAINLKKTVLYTLVGFLFLVMVVLSQSRGGIIVVLSGIAFFSIELLRTARVKQILWMMIPVVMFTTGGVYFFGNFFSSLVDRGSAGRFLIYSNAWDAINSSWQVFFFGEGAASSLKNNIGTFTVDHYHNFYLNTWYMTGLVGLVLVLLMVGVRFVSVFKKGSMSVWDPVLAGILVGFLFDGTRWYSYPSAMLFCFFIPLILANLPFDGIGKIDR